MLLNLSNHPSATWPPEQLQAAVQAYGHVEDLPFPQVPPDADTNNVEQLAETYLHQILALRPAAVHLMGELTFCCRLVHKLKAAGIPALASTTARNVAYDENGNKISSFSFVRFREY